MDELFRRAAENYPLDTRGSDWEQVAAKLAEAPPPEPVRKKDRRHLLWLLLLIPFTFLCNRYYPIGGKQLPSGIATQGNPGSASPAELSTGGTSGPAHSEGPKEEQAANTPAASGNASTANYPSGRPQELNAVASSNEPREPVAGTTASTAKKQRTTITGGGLAGNAAQQNETDIGNSGGTVNDHLRSIDKRATVPFPLRPLQAGSKLMDFSSTVRRRQEGKKRDRRFYAGLVFSGDVTTIRFQKVEEAGFSYGALLGYSFNSRWSVETGVYRDRKSYYSDGEYVGNKNIYVPPNAELTDVRGVCTMYEIPVNIRYNFRSNPRNSFFATAGVSSYIMKQEKYAYDYYYFLTGYTHTYRRTYTNASRNLFSVIGLTGGYTRKLGRVGDLRVEPYLKLPIGKMGYGKLPLTSAGLHVGITRTLF